MAVPFVHPRQRRVLDRCFFAFASRVPICFAHLPRGGGVLQSSSPPEKDFQSCNGGVDSQVKKITENICFHEATNPNFIGIFRGGLRQYRKRGVVAWWSSLRIRCISVRRAPK